MHLYDNHCSGFVLRSRSRFLKKIWYQRYSWAFMGLFNWGQRFAYFGLSSPIIVDVVSHSGKPWDSTGLLNQGQKFASPVQNCVLAKSSPKIKLSIRILRLSKTPILVTVYISMPCCTKFRGQEINLSIFVLQSLILDTLKCWTLPNSG